MEPKVGSRHGKPVPQELCEDKPKPLGIIASTDSIDQSLENDGETVRDDQAIAVILDPTLKVATCVATVSN